MNKRLLFFLVLAALLPGVLSAQNGSIHGTIIDANSNTPVAAARVVLVGAHLEELSHADGSFHFDRVPPGRHTIRIERLGYAVTARPAEVQANERLVVRFALTPSAIEVAPLLVTGTLTRRRADEMLSSTAALTGQRLDRNANTTVAATIASQPGVSVSSIGPATARPIIRGLGGDRILMLEDGQRTGDMSATSGDHAVAIEVLTASQIEVVRGPMSLLYGSSAMGGVVNVVKNDIPETLPEHPYGQFSLEAASAQPGGAAGAMLVSRVGPVAARVEASGRLAGDLQTPTGKLRNTDLNTYSAAIGLGRGGEWGHAGATYRYYTNEYGIPGHPGGHEEGVTVDMRRHTLRGQTELHREGALLSSLELTALGTDYEHSEIEESGEIATFFHQRTASGEAFARVEPKDSELNAAFGVRAQLRDVETGGELSTPDTRDYTIAGYAVSEFGRGRTRFQAGARYDWAHYEPREESFIRIGGEDIPTRARNFGSFSGSVGLLHELDLQTRIGLNLSRAYRTPDFNELYTDGPHLAANSYDVGDPGLEQETGLGADLFIRRSGRRISYDAALFIMQLNDYIFPSSRGRAELGGEEGDRPRFQYTNSDARFTGAEAQFTLQLTEKWSTEATASYVRAFFTSDRPDIPVITQTDTSFILASQYPPLIPPLNGHVALRYAEGRKRAGAEVKWAADATRLGDFERPTEGYAVLNLDAGIQLMVGGRLHSITARIDNVFDTEYRNHLSRIKELMAQPGRNFAVLYRVTI
ncbi:MAG TPA: TonB-dependent receptor [Longimicrobiales bacterium]|nr:TonB-dependent receptor [Longimicrobiales bacterium]